MGLTTPPAQVVASAPDSKKKRTSPTRLIVALAVFVGILAFGYKFLLSSDSKFLVNRIASNSGLNVTPWIDRAQAALQAMVDQGQLETIGKSSLAVIHPTGAYTRSKLLGIRKEGDDLVLEFQIDWKGGLLGTGYGTWVRWRSNKQGHVRAEIIQDNALMAAAEPNRRQLDEYFHTAVWPALSKNAGE